MGDIFDQLATNPGSGVTPPPMAAPKPQGGGDIFDSMASGTYQHPLDKEVVQPYVSPYTDIAKGVGEGALDTVNTVSSLINKIPVVGETLAPKQGIQAAESMAEAKSPAEKLGKFTEGIAEFILGDEALKSLSVAKRLGIAKSVAELAEKSPTLAKALDIGMNSVRTGTVAGGQALSHGATPTEAIETGTAAGLTGAAGDTIASGIESLVGKTPSALSTAVAPSISRGTKTIAGEAVPVIEDVGLQREAADAEQMSQMKNVTNKELERTYVKETEPAAKKTVGKLVNESVQAKAPGAPPVGNFEEAGKFYKSQADPVFKKLDELSQADADAAKEAIDSAKEGKIPGWQHMEVPPTFSKLQRMERAARTAKDFNLVDDLQQAQQDMIEKYSNHFQPGDLDEAKQNWKRYIANQDIHEAFTSPAVVSDTPDELVANKNVPDPGYWKGKPLLRTIRQFANDGTFERAGMPKQSIAHMQELGRVLEQEGKVSRFNAVFRQLAATSPGGQPEVGKEVAKALTRKALVGAGGAMMGGPGGSAAAVAADQWLVPRIMSKLASNPKSLQMLVSGIRSSAAPSVVANSLRQFLKEDNEPPRPDQ